jgi:hypothetical protein
MACLVPAVKSKGKIMEQRETGLHREERPHRRVLNGQMQMAKVIMNE